MFNTERANCVNKKTWSLAAIASIPLMMTLGNSMLIPVLPVMERELNITPLQSSFIITVYSIVAVVFIPIAGILSDRIGRKMVIIPSLCLAGIGGLISGLAAWLIPNPYTIIIIARLLQGLGAAGAFPIVLPLVGDLYNSEKQISHGLGIVETSNTFGKVLSPVLGAVLATIVWFLPFLAIPVLSLISIIAMIFLVKNPTTKEKPVKISVFFHAVKQIFIREGRWLIAVYAIGCITMTILFGVLFYLSSLLENQYGIADIPKGFVLAIPLASLCLASYLTGLVLGQDKQHMKWAAFAGMLLFTIASFPISFFTNIYALLIALLIGGAGIGVTLPALDALITESIEKEERGTITSFYSSMRFAGVAIGPPLFALLMRHSHQLVFGSAAALGAVGVLVIFFFIRIPAKSNNPSP